MAVVTSRLLAYARWLLRIAAWGQLLVCAACLLSGSGPVSTGVQVLQSSRVRGVVLAAADPSVVFLRGIGSCTGALLSPSVVLTARPCLSEAAPLGSPTPGALPPLLDATTISVTSASSQTGSVVVNGLSIVAASGAAASMTDVAFLILAKPIEGGVIRRVRVNAAAVGGRLDTLGWRGTEAPTALVWKEHVLVTAGDGSLSDLREESCGSTAGTLALDEATGEVVAILTGRRGACDSADDAYTELAPYADLVGSAIAAGRATGASGALAQRPTESVGAGCSSSADCATSVCVHNDGAEFCSRACSKTEVCPARSRCTSAGIAGDFCFPQ